MTEFAATKVVPKNRFQTLVSAKEIKEGKRFKQKEIADGAGVSAQIVSRWMNNVDIEITTLEIMMKLCAWLGCQLSELVVLEDGGASNGTEVR